jgi:hypothetical protein
MRGSDLDPPVSLASCLLHHPMSGGVGRMQSVIFRHLPLSNEEHFQTILSEFATSKSLCREMRKANH